jgi:NADH-quinone oxidoreductase subunit J
VSRRNLIAAVMGMVGSFIGIAAVYMMLYAQFLAVIQMLVYAGAIMVLFVFVIMLLNAGVEERTNVSKLAGIAGIPLAVALLGFLAAAIARSNESAQAGLQSGALANTKEISTMLFREFVYPFELTSFLILVAILGAIVLAQREKS